MIVFVDGSSTRHGELGASWLRAVKKRLNPEFVKKLKNKELRKDLGIYAKLLVLAHDQPFETVDQFAAWFDELNLKMLFEYTSLPASLLETFLPRLKYFAYTCDMLKEWDRCYFAGVDPAVITGLARNARENRRLIDKLPAVDLIEQVTCGIRLEEVQKDRMLLLAPQYHAVPMNIYTLYSDLFISHYPADVLPAAPGEPSPRLMRLASALADQSRLRILRFLARDERTFMEIVKFSGLAKSTVHYHLIALRAAGLVRAHLKGDDAVSYSLRRSMLEQVGEKLIAYVDEWKELESEA